MASDMQENLHLCILTTQTMLETFSSSVFLTTKGTIKHTGALTWILPLGAYL